MRRFIICCLLILTAMMGSGAWAQSLPRADAPKVVKKAMKKYLKAVDKEKQDLHSIMVVQHGKVLFATWRSEGQENVPHVLHSVRDLSSAERNTEEKRAAASAFPS